MVYIIIGFFSGIISGMGIGGGVILIPALVIYANLPQQMVQGISLTFFIPVGICALIVHIKNKNVEFKKAIPMIITGVIGALIGASIALAIPGEILKKLFAVFLLLLGIYELTTNGNKTVRDK